MSVFKDNYTSFLKDVEENIKNKEDLEYITKRFEQFYNQIESSSSNNKIAEMENKLKDLENKQNEIDEKFERIEEVVSNIEKDIYSEEGFDFEIVCPYCNYEFVIDVDEEKTEVECPECKNIIALDWLGDLDDDHLGCNGGCSSCHGCGPDDEDDDM